MIFTRLRNSATQGAAALAMAGMMSSAPVQAVQIDVSMPMQISAPVPVVAPAEIIAQAEPAPLDSAEPAPLASVAETVADLVDPVAAPIKALSYLHIGRGEASYYGHEQTGNRTASGERFNPRARTAAHRTLPMGTKLRVTNSANGRSVIVRINDRGPFVGRRIIDVSLGAAQEIQMVRSGKAMVTLERVS